MIEYGIAKESDIDSLVELENECFIHPFSRKDLLYEINDNPVNKIIVAKDGGKIAGVIDYMITFNSATITQIAVTSSFRRKGIGLELLKRMEETFPKNIEDMVETITLEVRKTNEPAHLLYLKAGYEDLLIKKNYYQDGEDAIYMIKRLI